MPTPLPAGPAADIVIGSARNEFAIAIGAGQRRFALGVAAAVTLIALSVLPYARTPLPEVPPFLPAFLAAVALMDLITALLFFIRFSQTRLRSQAALGAAYLFTGLIVIPHILVFPGMFSPQGLLGAQTSSAVWLWVAWHGGFACLLLVFVLYRHLEKQPLAAGAVTRFGLSAALCAIGLVIAATLLALQGDDLLPVIIRKGDYTALITSGVGPAVLLLNVAAFAAIWHSTRARYTVALWLVIAALTMTLDVTVTLAGGARYSLGWYVARLSSLLSAGAVLGGLLYEIHTLYAQYSRANRRLAALAATDGLTGLYNRREFDTRLKSEWDRAVRLQHPLALLMIDVDHFKAYNDTYGHPAGDECLRKVAQAVAGALKRPADMAARYGGEEIAVLMPTTDPAGALHLAEKIRAAIEALDIEHRGSSAARVVTASLGAAALTPARNSDPVELVSAADGALYAAKQAGRNRVVAEAS